MALHRNSDAETVTMTVELPTLKQRDVNVERSENHDKGERMVRENSCGKFSRTW
ncbi:hypothetical protein CY34DRAFT_804550 [Suillus luteus UH-Slu-Lm8-n1]|uniref:SHSP domain-containing protein n=1 Tax=Suillus luteus UH-Slu-Lm8-n1 TaxID=930992 RepID=A0A0D0B8U7_9AGAM|nr:hypothetical protein CY34DRAFT_804550 [Suillus luteus UH-Slu-Lm8-n1]